MTDGWKHEDTLRFAVFDGVGTSGATLVASCLAAEITAGFGLRDEAPFSIVARCRTVVAGGLNDATHWGWFSIRQLWVQEDWRRRGLGRRLLVEAEIQARAQHCAGLYVDTFDAGAALFYERAGFTLCGRIEGFPLGRARMFLCQKLSP